MSVEFHELEIMNIIRETDDCRSFELRVPGDLTAAYRYKAGQHLTFKFSWDDFEVTRCYSLASCPELGETMKIGVKRVADGRISNWINDQWKAGDKVLASAPEGRFVLDPETRPSTPLFLLAGGSGITPIISLLKTALATTKRPVTLVYANRDLASIVYGAELDLLLAEHADRLTVHHHLDSSGGYLDASSIRTLIHHTDVAEFYICGPEAFMNLVEQTLRSAGVHEELVYIERFVSPADPDRVSAAEDATAALPAPETFSLWLNGRSRTVPYLEGKTLLESAQAAGLSPPHSCESGFCGSCTSAIKTGRVHMRTHEALSERDLARGVALLCQSVPASVEPLELDADSTSFRAASAVKSSYSRTWSRLAAVAVFAFIIGGTLLLRSLH